MPVNIESGRVVVAGTTRGEIENLLPTARALAETLGFPILLLGLVMVPKGESLSTGARPVQRLRQELDELARAVQGRVIVRVEHDPWREAQLLARGDQCDFLLVNCALPDDILRALPCDAAIVLGNFPAAIRRILLPIRGGPNAALSLQVALALAQAHHAEITLLHAAPGGQLRDEQYREFLQHLHALPEITRWINVRGDAARAIVRHARDHQVVVMGAIARPQPGDPPIGPTATRVADGLSGKCAMLIVKAGREFPEPTSGGLTVEPIDYTISVVVDKWFAENTFHAHEFEDIKQLVALKERQGLTISLGLPTLNEEQTIGKVIRTMREALMRRHPLLDEIVVIDSDSTDSTAAIAQDLGVPVYRHPEILPQYGTYRGKGEALWKSLYVLKGDLIAWIDTDIENIHPRFVYGVLGPLLQDQNMMYVKGFYQRPLRMGRKVEARGGGRVTELTARPLLNLFYPVLSGIIQPLSGEYAGRRSALELVPFFSGYGVETGLMIDLLECCGLRALGQVDLKERIHRNQSLVSLSQMAFAILQVVMQRVGAARQVELLTAENQSMKLIRYEPEHFWLDLRDIRDLERPPMFTLPEYRQARAALARTHGSS